MNEQNTVRRSFLTYLAKLPSKLAKETPPESRRLVAGVCLDLGNLMLWLQPHVEPGAPNHEQPLNETAQSLWALGTQFRAVGLHLWDSPFDTEDNLQSTLLAEVRYLRQELVTMRIEKGGGK